MADAVTVSSDDIRAVAAVFTLAVACCGPAASSVPGFDAATDACQRMINAACQPQLPEDPVSGGKAVAITLSEQMREYEAAEFSRHEAFELIKLHAAAAVQLGAMRSLHG